MKYTSTAPLPVYSLSFWKAYLVQMRPYLLFVSGAAGAAGIAMAAEAEVPLWRMVVAFIPFFLGYGFGQALTDCFQTDTDALSAPYRPLSQGRIAIRSVLIVSMAGLGASAVLFFLLHPISLLLSVLAVFGLATYSYVKKHYYYGGPFYNAWIVALLPVMAYFAVLGRPVYSLSSSIYQYIALSFFSYASFVLIGYLKDIAADSATGYKTFPVVFGWDKTIWLGDLFALATLLIFWWRNDVNGYELFCGLAASFVLVTGQVYGHLRQRRDEKEALFPILATVRSFVLFHLAVVLHFQPQWWVLALVYYILFEVFLWLRPSRYQV